MIWTAIWAYALILFSGIIFDIILDFFNPQFKTTLHFLPITILNCSQGAKIVFKSTYLLRKSG